jgi:outer membrane protein assembly factor BamA
LTKNVPKNHYLLKKNVIKVKGDELDKSGLESVIKQKPNRSFIGIKARLWAYNQNRFLFLKSDSLSIAKVRVRKNLKLKKKNEKRLVRQARINQRRMQKARHRGDSLYYEKIVKLKDTLEPHRFLREWFKYKFGEPPVIFDSASMNRSVLSMENYMMKKGYFYSKVTSVLDTNVRRRKISVQYLITTNKPYIIDSINTVSDNEGVLLTFQKFLKDVRRNPDGRLKGQNLDSDVLNTVREKLAKFFRDNGYYGFSASHITITADTSLGNYKAAIKISLGDRIIRNGELLIKKPQEIKHIRNVYFHLADTTRYKGDFASLMKQKGIDVMKLKYLPTFDTLQYRKIKYDRRDKKSLHIPMKQDSLDPSRMATFYFNNKPYVRPTILELQNYLEEGNYYKEYYVERSISRMIALNVFQIIKPELIEIEGTNQLDVHYYLVPSKRQRFSFEPKFTNSNGFLGAAASINYTNKNLFHGGESLTVSFAGGFESTPPVISGNLDNSSTEQYKRIFNTFEFGPTVKLEIPGLFPAPAQLLTKRKTPTTTISIAYNQQHRPDFDRKTFQFNYMYRFVISPMQIVQAGLPLASVMKYVLIDKSAYFQEKINQTNDLFLRNAYSNQFIWEDFKLIYEFTNANAPNRKKLTMLYNVTFNHAGFMANALHKGYNSSTNQGAIFGVAYSQFARLDNEIIGEYKINKKQSFNFRIQIGGGLPYGNIKTSLPYDYSFYAGGSNDNRGWAARTLGPGSYKYYLDLNRTITQIGDIRLGSQAEYRIAATNLFKFAFFLDANNIWTLREDVNRPGSQISKNFYKEIALSTGVGLRLDFSFFIIRLDLGLPLTNPALPSGAKWIFQSRQPYYDEGIAKFGADYKSKMPRPFRPAFNFGIGYPF